MFPYLSFQCHAALPGWAVSCPCASQMSLMCRNTSLWLGITSLVWLERCFLSPCEPELFSFCTDSISGHLLSDKSWESIPMNEWMYIQILTADKHIYLLPCVHLMQDFCTVPNSSVCCLTGQAKLSLFHGEGGILMSFVMPGALPPWHQWRTWTFTGEPSQGFSGVNQICWEEAMSNLRGSCSYSSTI